ncbi:hypothetical protein AXG93_3833s1190 [Marchantia polymorpha subsp. ruderalis]|uniref:Uncharacterized protein n=1 Tax=Marchantia polymorpha subsp. ruderalis TaxID=1480154 RepID=A0A176VK26_MARPO|nr:hypothetical protein AXG93_3833s1190 [Marchantia polymorpha subsp. ruderalis]
MLAHQEFQAYFESSDYYLDHQSRNFPVANLMSSDEDEGAAQASLTQRTFTGISVSAPGSAPSMAFDSWGARSAQACLRLNHVYEREPGGEWQLHHFELPFGTKSTVSRRAIRTASSSVIMLEYTDTSYALFAVAYVIIRGLEELMIIKIQKPTGTRVTGVQKTYHDQAGTAGLSNLGTTYEEASTNTRKLEWHSTDKRELRPR